MKIESLEMTSKMIALIIKNPEIKWSDIISELSIPQYDPRARPRLKESLEALTKCKLIKSKGDGKDKNFIIPNPNEIANGNLLINVYNSIELEAFKEKTDIFSIAKSIIIHIYKAGKDGIKLEEIKELFPKLSYEDYESAIELVFEVKSIKIKEENETLLFEGSPMGLIGNINGEINILTGDIDTLEESSVKKVNFSKLSTEDKNEVVLLILKNIPATKETEVSRNNIARNYSRSPEVKYLGRQILIDLIDIMKEQGLIDTVENKSGKRNYLFLTESGQKKLKDLSKK